MASKFNITIGGNSGPIIMGDDTRVDINTANRDIDSRPNINVHPPVHTEIPRSHTTHAQESNANNDMNHRIIQGYALIIHNDMFPNRVNPDRSGSENDVDEIKQFCKNAGLHIVDTDRSTNNLTATEIDELCEEISKRDFSRYDAFICFILSHGNEGGVHGVDDNVISIQAIVSKFKDNTGLVGKPKLFFIQACRGPSQDSGVESDSLPVFENSRLHLPTESDILIVHSSVKGYESYRSPEHGSWFIITLMEQLNKYAHQLHLMDILTLVNNKIATYKTPTGKKQMSCQMSTLTKFVYFKMDNPH